VVRSTPELLTLHYSLGAQDAGEALSTFGGTPATLALGQGELAPGLERCLAGVEPGKRYVFLLDPGQAFGERRDALVQTLARSAFPPEMELEPGAVVEFTDPGGASHAGVVLAADAREVRMDFNHPLAGRRVRFEVEVLSIL
jgi:FKBP-type peptidyl-prolyl cis-trans isomerase SlpA